MLASSVVAGSAYGHHSFSMFDMDRNRAVTLEGCLIRLEWTNPHAYLHVETIDDHGEAVVWQVEAIAAPQLERRGISLDSLAVGDLISVEAYPASNAERRLVAGAVVTTADGSKMVIGVRRGIVRAATPAPSVYVAAGLSGVWLGNQGLAQINAPSVLNSWPLTDKGGDAWSRYDGSQNPGVNCVPLPAPSIMLFPEINSVEFDENVAVIRSELINGDRVIYLDGRQHPENAEPSNQGHSIGWWEGDVLVVDTVHFTEHLFGNGYGVPSGLRKHVIERISLSEDRAQIIYSFVLEDPEYLTEPVSGGTQWQYRPDLEFEQISCDPESARRFLDAF